MMELALDNKHAQAVAAVLRHTVSNPRCPTMPLDYVAWQRIKIMSKPGPLHQSQVEPLIQDYCSLLASISEHARLWVSTDNLAWLVQAIERRDKLSLSLVLMMSVMQPKDDLIGLAEVAQLLGHKSTSTLRTWIGEGRFFSATKPGGRDWFLAKSELEHRNDIRITKE